LKRRDDLEEAGDTATARGGAPPRLKTILFLCTGNYYRSRFAEAYFNALARRTGLPWRAESRGLALEFGVHNVGPISAHTLARLGALGIPAGDGPRPPAQVAAADLGAADLVVAVKEAEHRPLMRERFPDWEHRVEYWHVHDLDCATPADALPGLQQLVEELVARLTRSMPLRG
jgi:protein-tyrosine phosphatase